MSPLSVLRIWGLGIFGWALLGLGIYLAIETYDHFSKRDALARVAGSADAVSVDKDKLRAGDELRSGVAAGEVEPSVVERPAGVPADEFRVPRIAAASDDWTGWALLAGAIACLGMSLVGYWPVSLFLGDSRSGAAHRKQEIQPTSSLIVGRPDGSQLNVEIYGEDKRPTLLLTHGWSLDTSAWDYAKADLARRYRIVAWDLPGLGKSKGPSNADFSLEKMAHDLEAVLRATDNGSPVILVGHSIGGMILQTFCRLHPEHLSQSVRGLALVHTTYTNPLRTITASGLATALETPLIVPMNYLTIILAPLAWLSNWQSYFNGSLHIWTRLVSFAGHQSWSQIDHGARLAAVAWPATVARGNLAMLKFDAEQTLPNVQVPVLVVVGAHDRVTRPVASQRIELLLPNDRPMTIDGGHLGYWELSERVVDALRDFAEHVFASSHTDPRRDSEPVTGGAVGR